MVERKCLSNNPKKKFKICFEMCLAYRHCDMASTSAGIAASAPNFPFASEKNLKPLATKEEQECILLCKSWKLRKRSERAREL